MVDWVLIDEGGEQSISKFRFSKREGPNFQVQSESQPYQTLILQSISKERHRNDPSRSFFMLFPHVMSSLSRVMLSLGMPSISLQVAARKRNTLTIDFANLRRSLAGIFLKPFISSKEYSLLSSINRISICRSGTYKGDTEPPVFNGMDEEKRRRQKKAEEIKRLQFPSVFLACLREEHAERHIRDALSLDSADGEDEASDKGERELRYTDAFKEGNVITKVFFEGEELNPVCMSN